MTRDTSKTMVPLLTGAVGAVGMQAWTGWWLNSGTGVAWTLALLLLLGALVGVKNTRSPWAGPMTLWAGAMTGLTMSLFWLGPGTIWPIVLLVSSVLTASAIVVGRSVRWASAWVVWRRRP